MKYEINFNPFCPSYWKRFVNWFFRYHDIECENIKYKTRKEYEEVFKRTFEKLIKDEMIEVK